MRQKEGERETHRLQTNRETGIERKRENKKDTDREKERKEVER